MTTYRTFSFQKDPIIKNVFYIRKENGRKFYDPDGTERSVDSVVAGTEDQVMDYIDKVYFGDKR